MKDESRRIRLAKLLDAYLGPFLIFLMWLVEKAVGKKARCVGFSGFKREEIGKILFIKFWGMGSVILSEPALRFLSKTYPQASIHYLTLGRNRQIFRLLPKVSEVHSVAFRGWRSLLLDSLRLLRTLRAERFDLVFDGEFFVNYSGLVARAVCNKVIGFSRGDGLKKRIQSISIPFQDDLHSAAQFLRLTGRKGIPQAESLRPRLALGNRLSRLQLLLTQRRTGLEGQDYVVMNVNASLLATERRWPRRNFIVLGRWLLQRYQVNVVLTGSKPEKRYVDTVEHGLSHSRVHNLCGMLELGEFASLLKGAACLISNDSGPVHLASAFNTPVVSFYGPETPVRYGPLSSASVVFFEDLWCSPCMSIENAKTVNCINKTACMRQIDPTQVIERLKRFFERHNLLKLHRRGQRIDVSKGRYA